MTREELHKVIDVIATADNGCSACVRDLIIEFLDRFPEWADYVENALPYTMAVQAWRRGDKSEYSLSNPK